MLRDDVPGDQIVLYIATSAPGGSPKPPPCLAPPKSGCDVGQNGFDHMSVVLDAELIGNGQEQGVGLGDGFIRLEFLDQCIRLGRVAAAKNRSRALVDEPDLVVLRAPASEIGTVAIVDQREDTAAD